jgi:L-seryl-tRNA(Ser) seleniumtransferase
MTADGAAIYHSLGVKPAIVASGYTTAWGGSRLRPEVVPAMNAVSGVMVSMDQLNRQAGNVLAEVTGAEAGFVCSGSAGGLIMQAAAVIAGSDPAKMARLPDTSGMNNEIIIHKVHRFPYDQCYRSVGAKFVEIGDGRRCRPWELEAAFSERTAAVAYLFSPFISRGALPFEQVCEIAHAHDIPVLVNAASYLPPRTNLQRFSAAGADMVVYSGGKAVRGPQGTGILVGRQHLIDAAFANASPQQFIGRGLKVAKEEIIGLVKALELFVAEDEAAQFAHYRAMCRQVVDALRDFDGLSVTLEHDEVHYLSPHAVMRFTRDWPGRPRDSIRDAMLQGDPQIFMHDINNPDELAVDPVNLSEAELDIVIARLRQELGKT